jgi:hypothetical protein
MEEERGKRKGTTRKAKGDQKKNCAFSEIIESYSIYGQTSFLFPLSSFLLPLLSISLQKKKPRQVPGFRFSAKLLITSVV